MRVENSGIIDISKSNKGMEIKGSDTAAAEKTSVPKCAPAAEKSYGVTATTVEKALFSLESELDKIKQDAQNIDIDTIKTQMAVLSNTLSGEDLEQLQEKGYSLNDTQVKTIVTVMDKIKMELARGGMDISVFGDDLSMEQLEAMTGSASQAMQMASALTECQEGDIAYLTENELEPTIENLYWAQHSGSRRSSGETPMLPEDENLQKQIAQVIREAGLPVNETTLGYGALFLEHQIPLTPENIAYADRLQQMQLPPEKPEIEKAVAEAVSEGKEPREAYLMEGYSARDRAIKAQEIIEQTGEEELKTVVESGEPITIEALGKAGVQQNMERRDISGRAAFAAEETEDIRFITARRQLEEIRLTMTVQAGYRLLKQGISIETMELEELVEELKNMETDYYKTLLEEQGIEPTQESAELFRETTEKTESLKVFPAYLLGRYTIETTTVQELYEGGSRLKNVMEQANEAYETMMTTPRRDLGDSLQKAFQNVDDILKDLNLETSTVNQRAVRILAYNQMEINVDTISQIKAADEKMQNLFHNMKPSVVMEMIREGINPLHTDVTTLNAKAEEIAEQLDPGQEERYSSYLWKLEQNHEISQEERESYIGIYRLLRQIEKTDGAVIGAVVNQGGELSLKNLLSAVRTRRSGGMNVTIDDRFGGIESITRTEASISQQIEAAYQTDCAKEAFFHLTPEGLQSCMANENWQNLTPEQLLWQLKEQQATDRQTEEDRESYQQQLQLFKSNQTAEASVLQMLKNYEIPMDTYHIMAAGQMINNRNSVFRKLFDSKNAERIPDLQKVKEDLLEKFAEAVKTPEDMAKAQQALAETAEHIMDTMINEPDISSTDVQDLKILRTQIQLTGTMSREENYAIPVLIADEMTNVQLKIVRGKEKRGMVDILFETEKLGKVAARLMVSSSKAEAFIVADKEETIEQLRQQEESFSGSLQEILDSSLQGEDGESIRFDYLCQENLNLTEFTRGSKSQEELEQGSEEYQIQTRDLYSMAKTFIETVKKAA